ncbi:MAG: CvpA family protein [Candidatus Azobacteroides sp.]|nr:CvpA family protein [Candidatus Azobacteroides sp.]
MRGFVRQIFSIAGFIIGIIAAYLFAKLLAPPLGNLLDIPITLMLPLSYFIVFIIVATGCNLLGRIFHNLVTLATLGGLNRIAGAVAGVLKYAFIIGIVLNLYDSIDKEGKIISPEAREKATLYEPLRSLGEAVLPYVEEFRQMKVLEKYQQLEDLMNSTHKKNPEPVSEQVPGQEV